MYDITVTTWYISIDLPQTKKSVHLNSSKGVIQHEALLVQWKRHHQ